MDKHCLLATLITWYECMMLNRHSASAKQVMIIMAECWNKWFFRCLLCSRFIHLVVWWCAMPSKFGYASQVDWSQGLVRAWIFITSTCVQLNGSITSVALPCNGLISIVGARAMPPSCRNIRLGNKTVTRGCHWRVDSAALLAFINMYLRIYENLEVFWK